MKHKMALPSRPAMAFCLTVIFLTVLPGPFARAASTQRSATTPALDQLRDEHRRVLDELNATDTAAHPLSFGDPRVPELLKKGWALAGAWAAAYLETHPALCKSELERIFDDFAPKPRGVKSMYGNFLEYHEYSFMGRAVRIGAAIYVVQASYFMDSSTGAFMVVARNQEGRFQVLWNIKDLAEKHYTQRDEIGRWVHLVARAYYNGPLEVRRVLPLSPTPKGHARFLVDAYQAADGGTILAQLSIWEWDGAGATPLLVKLYEHAADFGGFSFDGKTVRISTKEELVTFFSCGMCPEPRGVWAVRITPDGVRDEGHRFLTPEIQWADELLSKIQKGEDTTKLAEAKVVTALQARIPEVQAEDWGLATSRQLEFPWGMLGQCRVLRRGQRGAFELALDEGRLRFSYLRRNGRHYFTHVRIQ